VDKNDRRNKMNDILIRDAKSLISGIMAKAPDPMESGLERGRDRIIGGIAGLLFNLPVGMACGLYVSDAEVDNRKLQKIHTKLLELGNTPISHEAPNFLQAVAARSFQQDVYRNIAQYTKTARSIKHVAGISFGVSIFCAYLSQVSSQSPAPCVLLAFGGAFIGLSVSAGKLAHTLVGGSSLESTKQELAQQASKQLPA
jgi:hypothetical protein